MNIRTRLIVLVAVPTLALTGLATQGILKANHARSELTQIQRLSELNVALSALVHETQKERGMTAGFLSSKGAKFARELPAQRKAADERLAQLQTLLASIDAADYGPRFEAQLTSATEPLGRIKSIRAQVTSQSITLGDALAFYTNTHTQILNTIAFTSTLSSDAEITMAIQSYVQFLKGKERAGIERAVLAATFSSDAFGAGMYEKYVRLVSEQKTYFNEFSVNSSPANAEFFATTMKHDSVAQVEGFREIASAKAVAGGFGQDADAWFAASTSRINLLKTVEDHLSTSLYELAADHRATAVAAFWTFLTAAGGILLAVILGGLFVVRSVINPIQTLTDSLKDIAEGEGDLTQRVDESRQDELGRLSHWFNVFVGRIHDVICVVQESSDTVAAGTNQLSGAIEELATGMRNQAEQSTQVAAAVEELSATVTEVAQKSAGASRAATDAGNQASGGGEVVRNTVDSIRSIAEIVNTSSQAVAELGKRGEEIGQVIDVINDIADQTNLLALNAAIEAARAGEHGRGFAVVADEVRKLAERTTTATTEVAESIKGIQTETDAAVHQMASGTQSVDKGVHLAEQAGDTLNTIVNSSARVATEIEQIASASEQQSATTNQIAANLETINAVVRQSNEMTSQSAEAISDLSGKADQLQRLVSQFKVDPTQRAAA